MTLATGVAEHIQSIKIAEQIQGLLFIHIMQQRKSKNLAGTFVDARQIDKTLLAQAVAEFDRMILVVLVDHGDRVLKADRAVGFYFF